MAVRSAKAKDSPYKLTDGGGLHLLVTPAGGRLWRLAYRYGGKQKTLALGAYPTVGLGDARAGRENAKKLLAQGRDPSVTKRIQGELAEVRDRPTFAAVALAWFDARKKRWVPQYAERLWARVEQDLIGAFGDLPVDEVDSDDVLAALRKIEGRGAIEMARRVKNYARDIFRFARAAKLRQGDPTEDLEHALASPPPSKRRTAIMARDLPDFLAKLNSYDGDNRTRLAVILTLLTFVRTKELRFAKWTEFEQLDGVEPLWRLPGDNMKMRMEHLVPLSRQAVAVLDALRQHPDAGTLVVGAETRSGAISENTMLYALYRMGYHNRATIHGFRGTASTILNEHGFNRDWIERQLAHNERDQVRAAYNVAEWLPERRKMMQWWADYLEEKGLVI
jgi:integrase